MNMVIAYPFPRTPLSLAEQRQVADLLRDLEMRHHLLNRRPGLEHLCGVFLRHCSPPAPRPASLEVVTRFLHLVMYFADRVSPATVEDDAAVFFASLSGPPQKAFGDAFEETCEETCGDKPSALRHAASELGVLLRAELAKSGGDPRGFLHLLRVNLATFIWAASPLAPPSSLSAHMSFRTESICAIAYMRLWGLMGGLSPRQELRFGFLLQQMEGLSAQAQSLSNDLRSISRDAREGTPNAVLLLENEGSSSRQAAEEKVFAMHEAALNALLATQRSARAFLSAQDDAVSRYIDFIGICTQGNNVSMTDLAQRYDVNASTPLD